MNSQELKLLCLLPYLPSFAQLTFISPFPVTDMQPPPQEAMCSKGTLCTDLIILLSICGLFQTF